MGRANDSYEIGEKLMVEECMPDYVDTLVAELKDSIERNNRSEAIDKRFNTNTVTSEASIERFEELDKEDKFKAIASLHVIATRAALLLEYIEHNGCGPLMDARRDHWDILKEKCESDPMFKETWDELMILLRLEEN